MVLSQVETRLRGGYFVVISLDNKVPLDIQSEKPMLCGVLDAIWWLESLDGNGVGDYEG
jgi:hypothetical protein